MLRAMLSRMLWRGAEARASSGYPDLHRWCHRSSEKYKHTCDWQTKMDASNWDNHHSTPPPSLRRALHQGKAEERNWLNDILKNSFGF